MVNGLIVGRIYQLGYRVPCPWTTEYVNWHT